MTSGVDSRTILDTAGAEDLLGRGDMLYQPIDAPRAVRLQGVLVTDPRSRRSRATGAAQGGPQYRPEITAATRGGKGGGTPGEDDEDDDADALLIQAVDIVRRSRQGIGVAAPATPAHRLRPRGPHPRPDGGPRHRRDRPTAAASARCSSPRDGWGGDIAPGRGRRAVTDEGAHKLGEVLRAAREAKGVDLAAGRARHEDPRAVPLGARARRVPRAAGRGLHQGLPAQLRRLPGPRPGVPHRPVSAGGDRWHRRPPSRRRPRRARSP